MSFFNGFNNKEDIAKEFRQDSSKYDEADLDILRELKDAEVLIASYNHERYEGYALVVYAKNGKLYEVNGSHCSCNGLEGQWSPEETSQEAFALRYNESNIEFFKNCHGLDATMCLLKCMLNYEVEKNLLNNVP